MAWDSPCAEQEPQTKRHRDPSGNEREGSSAGQILDADDRADDYAGEGASAQRIEQSSLVPEAQQPAGYSENVENEIGRRDGRAGDAQNAQLDGQQ